MIKISKQNIIPNKWDGGLTYEYFIFPEESEYISRNFDFRISSATIEKTPSNFTRFSGYFRYLVMLDNSLEIVRNSNKEKFTKHEVFRFDSNEEVVSSSLGNDFNLIISNDISNHELDVFNGTKVLNGDWIILFVLSTQVIFINSKEIYLVVNDCIVIENHENSDVEIISNFELILAVINV